MALGIRQKTLGKRQAVMRKRTKLWAAMRMLPTFTVGDLMAACEHENRPSVSTYVAQLRCAGFVRVVRPGNKGRHEQQVLKLVRNTGPRAPAIVLHRAMFDPNTLKEHALESE